MVRIQEDVVKPIIDSVFARSPPKGGFLSKNLTKMITENFMRLNPVIRKSKGNNKK